MSTKLSEAQAAQALALTLAYKAKQNSDAAKAAAVAALYYQQRVDPLSLESVDAWLDLIIPKLIRDNDTGARAAARFFDAVRKVELPGTSDRFTAVPSLGVIDEGVRKSLLTVGPYAYANKAKDIQALDATPAQERALLAQAKRDTTKALGAAALRHAQSGPRQTIYENSGRDPVALGWVRVTRAKPCAFCAMLASRGLRYRPYREGSFDLSDARFSGDGDAKVHDECQCSMKQVYSGDSDKAVKRTDVFADMYSRWGVGSDPALSFRRGYDHWAKTGEYLPDGFVE